MKEIYKRPFVRTIGLVWVVILLISCGENLNIKESESVFGVSLQIISKSLQGDIFIGCNRDKLSVTMFFDDIKKYHYSSVTKPAGLNSLSIDWLGLAKLQFRADNKDLHELNVKMKGSGSTSNSSVTLNNTSNKNLLQSIQGSSELVIKIITDEKSRVYRFELNGVNSALDRLRKSCEKDYIDI